MPPLLHHHRPSKEISAADAAIPTALLQSYSAKKMAAYKVSTRVNSPKNNDAAIIDPLA